MKVKVVIFLLLAALTQTSVAVEASGLPQRHDGSLDDADSMVPPATHLPDDIDALIQAANDGILVLNASNTTRVKETSSALDNFAAAVAGLENSAATLEALVAEIKAINEQIKALRDLITALRNQIEKLSEKIDEVKAKADDLEQCTAIRRAAAEAYEKLIRTQQAKIAAAEARNQSTTSLKQELATLQSNRDEQLKKLEASCAKLISEIDKLEEQFRRSAKARKIFKNLAADRTKTSQLLQLIRDNNRTGLSSFLQREAGGGDFVISDAKVATGPLLIFRVDSISHCLSAASQCSGKSYLFTK